MEELISNVKQTHSMPLKRSDSPEVLYTRPVALFRAWTGTSMERRLNGLAPVQPREYETGVSTAAVFGLLNPVQSWASAYRVDLDFHALTLLSEGITPGAGLSELLINV